MDWVRETWTMSDSDLRNFEYESRRSQTIRLSRSYQGHRIPHQEYLNSDEELCAWLKNDRDRDENLKNHTTLVILGSRRRNVPGGFENPMELRYLPFTRDTFQRILDQFYIHGSIARVISRNYAATFSRTYLSQGTPPQPAIVYNCRSSAFRGQDMALSVTHFPLTRRTYAVWYGCNADAKPKDDITKISNRLIQSSENTFCHPMLLPGVFAEMERARMKELVRVAKKSMLQGAQSLHDVGYDALDNGPFLGSSILEIYELRNCLELWQKLLLKMVAHIAELNRDAVARRKKNQDTSLSDEVSTFRQISRRIKDRLLEIHLDYDEMIKDCTMVIDGMAIATNLVLARDNMKISTETVKISDHTMNDGKRMKSVAILTMIFLPATFIATLFSMTFFQLDASYAWLYPAITIPLTIVVVGAYMFSMARRRKKFPSGQVDEENGENFDRETL